MYIDQAANDTRFANALGGGEISVAELPSSPLEAKKKSRFRRVGLNQPELPYNETSPFKRSTVDNPDDPLAAPIEDVPVSPDGERRVTCDFFISEPCLYWHQRIAL